MSEGKYEALREAVRGGSDVDFRMNPVPVCPHCGREFGFNLGLSFDVLAQGEHQVECPHCGEDFTLKTYHVARFDTNFVREEPQTMH